MVNPGDVRGVDVSDGFLAVDAEWLGTLLVGEGSPERILGALVDAWLRAGWIRWGVFFLRREGGWVRLVSRGEDAPRGQTLRAIAFGDSSNTMACGFPLVRGDGEVGRLVVGVQPGADRRHTTMPIVVRHALTLYLAGVGTSDAGETDAVHETMCQRLLEAHEALPAQIGKEEFPGIIGQSAALRDALSLVKQVAGTDVSVLVHGESGTGKELFARLIHDLSERRRGPFVSENCAAFSATLLEGEIFGSEKGSFTGADATRLGLLERAHGGTLFLDEVAEMDLALQRKLLRVLQERRVRRVGGAEALPVDFRLITATHRDLKQEVAAGRFREDLLYRILVIQVPVPPLRERRDDIALLTRHFLREFARQRRVPAPLVDARAMEVLRNYRWPGNVRELRNEIERAFTLSPAGIRVESLSDRFAEPFLNGYVARQVRREVGADIRDLERVVIGGIIREVLEETNGNKTQAAAILGLPKTTFYRRLVHYGIETPAGGAVCENFDAEDEVPPADDERKG